MGAPARSRPHFLAPAESGGARLSFKILSNEARVRRRRRLCVAILVLPERWILVSLSASLPGMVHSPPSWAALRADSCISASDLCLFVFGVSVRA